MRANPAPSQSTFSDSDGTTPSWFPPDLPHGNFPPREESKSQTPKPIPDLFPMEQLHQAEGINPLWGSRRGFLTLAASPQQSRVKIWSQRGTKSQQIPQKNSASSGKAPSAPKFLSIIPSWNCTPEEGESMEPSQISVLCFGRQNSPFSPSFGCPRALIRLEGRSSILHFLPSLAFCRGANSAWLSLIIHRAGLCGYSELLLRSN